MVRLGAPHHHRGVSDRHRLQQPVPAARAGRGLHDLQRRQTDGPGRRSRVGRPRRALDHGRHRRYSVGAAAQRHTATIPAQGDPDLLPLLEAQGVEISAREPAGDSILLYFLPWILILGVYFWMQRRIMGDIAGGPGRTRGGLLSGRFSKPSTPARRVTFADVAGQDQAKRDVSELIDFLRDPDRFHRVGAEVPHGILLMGPPGTGKTLLAKALAGEADVPFFSTSGSEFIEIFVGVGAGRVRKMFEAARKAAPS